MSGVEYQTTIGQVEPISGYASHPITPVGDGWEMIGCTAAPDVHMPGRYFVLWFWRRGARPCACGAIARKDGRCLGCGEKV